MQIIEFKDNPRIDQVVNLSRQISLAREPRDVLMAISQHYWKLRPSDYMISMSTKGLDDGFYRITRQIDVEAIRTGKVDLEQADPWRNLPLAPPVRGGILGEFIRRRVPIIAHNLNIRSDPVLGDALAHLGSVVVLPLFDEGEPRYWNLAFRRNPTGYNEENMEHSLLVANLTGGTNTRFMLMEKVRTLNAALRHEFEEVARVQRALLPRELPNIRGLEIAVSYLTSEQAGGDYYDFFRFQDGRHGLFIADVSGHGAAAATVMAMLHGILHAYQGPSDPDTVLRYANTRLVEAGIEATFVTAFLAVYEPGRLHFARAGHNPPLLKCARDGRVRELTAAAAFPLGIADPYDITQGCIPFEPGDTLILYTDGITEAMSPAREMFGVERISAAVQQCTGKPACIVDSVHKALAAHTAGEARRDDQTLVAIRCVPA